MVRLRLRRMGAKKAPFYRVVAAHDTSPRDGRFIEQIGFFNPIASGNEERLRIQLDRIEHWQALGAQVSDRVQGNRRNQHR